MYIKRVFPYLVACYSVAVGLLFITASLADIPFLDTEPPGSYILSAISITFIFGGVCFICLLYKGRLKKEGKTIAEVRRESVEKIKDPSVLSKIALEDPYPERRKAAHERLKQLK